MKTIATILSLFLGAVTAVAQPFVPDTLGVAQAVSHNPAELIKGEIAGVNVSSADGSPTSVVSVDVRGLSTLRGDNQPLWIIDGAIIENASNTDLNPFWNYSEVGKLRPINSLFHLSAYDIESIEVLKDASATALYGARGAAGVIIVKTKRGGRTDRDISLRANVGLSDGKISHNYHVSLMGANKGTSYNISAAFRRADLSSNGYSDTGFNVKANVESLSGKVFNFGANALVGMENPDMSGNLYQDYQDNAKQYAATASAWIRLNFGKSVDWTTNAGGDFRSSNRSTWYGAGNNIGSYLNGLAGMTSNQSISWNLKSAVNFHRYFAQSHKLEASVGADFYGNLGDFTSLGANDYFSYSMAAKGISISNSARSPYIWQQNGRELAFFARVGYSFKDIVGVDATFRTEKTFSVPGACYDIYPAGSAWFDIHNLAFKESKAVSSLRIDGGWGISGNGKTMLYPFFDNVIDMTHEPDPEESKVLISGRSYQNLTEWHAGARLGFISDRIVLEGTYFDRNIKDSFTQYMDEALYRSRNSAFITRGVEAAVSFVPIKTRNVVWTIKANASYIDSRVTAVDNLDAWYDPGYDGSGFYASNMVGAPVGTLVGYKVNNDGSYEDVVPDGVINTADCVALGNVIPKVQGGVGTTLALYRFTLDLHGDFAAGFNVIDGNAMKAESRSVLTSRYVSRGDWFRISRVALSYDIPVGGRTVKGLNVALSGHNLATFSRFAGSNPEAFSFGLNPLARGIDYCGCPVLPMVILGAQIKF